MASVIFRNRLDPNNPVYAKPGRGTLSHTGTVSALSIGGASSGVSISSVSGTLSHGSTLTINGSGFGSHADFGGSETFLCKAWNDFTVSLEDGNWVFDGLVQDSNNLILATSGALGGACTQYYRKRNVNNTVFGRRGSVTVLTAANTGCWYNSFWYRQAPHSQLWLGHGTKFFRHYFGTSPRDWYLGPNFENTTEAAPLYEVGGKYSGRYSGTAAFGGTSAFNTLIDATGSGDVWHFYEVTEFTRGATSVFGSDDYLEIYVTVPGTGRQRMMRRGGDLPSNQIAAEGTDADETDKWIDDDLGTTDADGHTCGDLGSLAGPTVDGAAGGGGHMDYHDAYQSYTIARVIIDEASTFAALNKPHMQIPTSWSTTQIQVTANRGQYISLTGKYLYVVNSSNQVNSAGFAL